MPKKLILSSGRVNRYGYRVVPEGIDFKNYLKNPVLLFNHQNWRLPIGKIEDLKLENGKLVGNPVFDSADEFALEVKRKYEEGMINTASISHTPIETTDDPVHLKPGQRRHTVLKCELLEVSIVAIPGDPGAHSLSGDSIIKELSIEPKSKEMELTKEQKEIRKQLGLSEDASDLEVSAAVKAVKSEADNALSAKVDALMEKGKSSGFIDDDNLETYKSLALKDFDSVDKLIKNHKPTEEDKDEGKLSMKAAIDQNRKANAGGSDDAGDDKKLSFDYLQKNDPVELDRIRVEEPEKYSKLALAYASRPQESK